MENSHKKLKSYNFMIICIMVCLNYISTLLNRLKAEFLKTISLKRELGEFLSY